MSGEPLDFFTNSPQTGNIFTGIPPSLPAEIFETLWQNRQIRIERIISKGHSSPGDTWYDQEGDEWVLLLQGSAALQFENCAVVEMRAGDYLFIPARCKHRVIWTDPRRESIWLAIHLSAE